MQRLNDAVVLEKYPNDLIEYSNKLMIRVHSYIGKMKFLALFFFSKFLGYPNCEMDACTLLPETNKQKKSIIAPVLFIFV